MTIIEQFFKGPVWAPDGGAGGGEDTVAAGGGDDTATGGGDDTLAAGGGEDTATGGGEDTLAAGGGDDTAALGGGSDAWWQSSTFDETQQRQLKALGLTVDDPLDSVKSLLKMEEAAKAKLGKGADKLFEKPGEGQDVGEWLRANGDTFGIPEKPEDYEVTPPEDWPEDAPWDKDLEAEARKIAHEEGVHGKALQRMTELYAGKIKGMVSEAESELKEANARMMADLEKDWGDQTSAKIAQVQQIAAVVGERAGLDQEGMANIAAVLKPKVGDAGTIRLFAAIADLAADDTGAALEVPGGTVGTTPAEARAEIEKMMAPGSDYMKAQADKRDGKDPAEFQRLHKRYLELNKIASQ